MYDIVRAENKFPRVRLYKTYCRDTMVTKGSRMSEAVGCARKLESSRVPMFLDGGCFLASGHQESRIDLLYVLRTRRVPRLRLSLR